MAVLSEDFGVAEAAIEAAEEDAMQTGPGSCQAIMDPEPLLAADDQSMLAEVGEVSGDRGLRKRQGLVQMADADLLAIAGEQVQEAKAHGVSKRLEEAGGVGQGIRGGLFHTSGQI